MMNPQKKLKLASWYLILIATVSTGILGMVIFSRFNLGNFSSSKEPILINYLNLDNQVNNADNAKKVIGEWIDPINDCWSMLFSADGKLFEISRLTNKAKEGKYKIDVNFTPNHIDIIIAGETHQGIFDFTSDGSLILQTSNVGEPRPRYFSRYSDILILQKKSEVGTLPSNITVISDAELKRHQKSEAKTYVGSLNIGQQAYFTEKGEFGTDIPSLGIGIKTQTSNYAYFTTASGTGTKQTAYNYSRLNKPNSGLKNYSGLVSLTQAGSASDVTSVAILCETNQPDAPAITPINGTSCASGSTEIGR